MVKHGEPSNEELEYLSRQLAGKWKTLGGCLGFSQAAMRNYDEDNPKLADKAFNMLIDWKQGQGSKATYTVLNDALCHKLVNCKLLAEQFCCDKTEGNASQGLRDFNKAVRKKLADEKDATVDYDENKKTLIKRYVFRNNSVVYLSLVFCFLFSVFPSMKWYLVIIRNDSESFK